PRARGDREPRAPCAWLLCVDLGFAAHDLEEIGEPMDGFRVSEHEEARRLERVVEDRNDLLLHERPEVDEDVAATDEIQLREGRILREVLAREDADVSYGLRDLIAAV